MQPRFDEMVKRHGALLRATARRLCGRSFDPNDLVQDTLERAWRSFHRLRPGTNDRAWLLTILTNLFIDQLRRVRRTPRHESIENVALAAPEPEEEETAARPWEAVTPEELDAAISRLSEKLRVVYRMHVLEGADYAFIATQLGIPKATVGTRLFSARARLRELLAPSMMPEAA
jgi:RNA polymerase sigma-70 factor (ECF subfamily)